MLKQFYSVMLGVVLASVAGLANAETRSTLDEVLAGTLGPAHTTQAQVEARTCRTLTDMGRRARRETVCMTPQAWRALIVAALVQKPQPMRSQTRGYGR